MVTPYSYWFRDGTSGCVMAYNKSHAISTIIELHPAQAIIDLSLHIEPEWTSNPLCASQVSNTYPTPTP